MQQPPHANMIFLAFSLLYCDIFALVAALQNQSTPAAAATATAALLLLLCCLIFSGLFSQ